MAEGGYYEVILEVADNASNKLNSSPIMLYYDGTAPTRADVMSPANNSWTTSMTIVINVTDGSGQAYVNYSVYVNGTLNVTAKNGSNQQSTNVGLTGLQEGGYYNISVRAIDNASNTNNTFVPRFLYYDATEPDTAVIVTPSSNDTWVNSMVIGFNGTDGVATILNYVLYVNGSSNATGNNLTGTIMNDSLTDLAEGGYYEVILEVADNASNKLNSSPIMLYYDGTGPTISGSNNGTTSSSRVISFNVTDVAGEVNQSSIAVSATTLTGTNTGDAFNATTMCTTIATGFTCSYTENALEIGANVIAITASDNASNDATAYQFGITPSAAVKYNNTLVSGWNLISTPVRLEDTTINNIVANNSNITTVYYYDGSSWDVWRSTGADDLTIMEPLNGYWVYATAATNMPFFGNYSATGQSVPSLSKTLTAGTGGTWYMIGHYDDNGATNINTTVALMSLCDGAYCDSSGINPSFDVLKYYASSAWVTLHSGSKTEAWDKGRGFWIHMDSSDYYTK